MMFPTHYNAVKQNIKIAARIFFYYIEISSHTDDEEKYNALNTTARFWNDFNFIALQSVVINLGKIFDNEYGTHNLSQMIKILRENLDYFNKDNFRHRKIRNGLTDTQILEETVARAHEMTLDDVKVIAVEVRKARALWEKIKPIRNKFYAHHQAMTDDERDALFKNVTYDEIEEIIQIILNVCFVLEMAELNGRKPNFDEYQDNSPENIAEQQVDTWLNSLVRGYKK